MTIKVDHEFRDLIPPLSHDELKGLRASIERDGCLDPLKVWDGVLLDGHNRLVICEELGIEYATAEVLGLQTREHAKAWILKNQLGRRNLKEGQRAMLATQLEEIYAGPARERQEQLGRTHGKDNSLSANLQKGSGPTHAAKQAAADMHISERSVHHAKTVKASGIQELQSAVMAGTASVSAAAEVARLPEEEQRVVVAEGPKAIKEKAKEQREQRAQNRQIEEEREELIEYDHRVVRDPLDTSPATPPPRPEPSESKEMYHVKRYYKMLTKKEKQSFKEWINEYDN